MATNPYKRLRELTLTSQKDFAAKYELSKTAMTYIESGQVVELSERMILALGQECYEKQVDARQVLADEYAAPDLQTAYQNWKSLQRMENAHLFQKPVTGSTNTPTSPFSSYIRDVAGSAQKFCKLLKVPAASVQLYAKGDIQTMPKAVETALIQVRFPWLEDLKKAQSIWLTDGGLLA